MAKKGVQASQPEIKGFEEDPLNGIVPEDQVQDTGSSNPDEPEEEGQSTELDLTKVDTTTDIVFSVNNKEVNLAIIEGKKKEYSSLEITDIYDKENYEKVRVALAELRTTRVTLGKFVKETLKPVKDWIKKQGDDAKELQDKIAEIEAPLKEKKEKIDNAVEIENERRKAEKEQKIQGRVNNLFKLGAAFDEFSSMYTFPYNEDLIFNAVQIKEFEDEEWEKEYAKIQTAFDTYQAAELKKKQDEEEELQRIKDAGTKLDAREQALQDKQIKIRSKELSLYDAEFDEEKQSFVANGVSISMDDVISLEDDAWELVIAKIESGPANVETTSSVEPAQTTNENDKPEYKGGGITGSGGFGGRIGGGTYSPPDAAKDFAEFEDTETNQVDPLDNIQPEGEITDVEFEDEIPLDIDPKLTEIWFTPAKPYIDTRVSKSILRLYHPDFEELANTIAPENVIDCGRIGEENLSFIIYKPVVR